LCETGLWLGREDEGFTSGSDEVLQGGSIREIASRWRKRKKIKIKDRKQQARSESLGRYLL
jgi:hypothetical protein